MIELDEESIGSILSEDKPSPQEDSDGGENE